MQLKSRPDGYAMRGLKYRVGSLQRFIQGDPSWASFKAPLERALDKRCEDAWVGGWMDGTLQVLS